MPTYKVAIIGLGRMGSTIDDEGHFAVPYSVAAATKASEHLELVAGADVLPEKREVFQERWGAEVYEDFRAMIEKEKPDVVYAIMPPHHVYDLAANIMDMGINIVIEKPPTVTTEQAKLSAKTN